MGVGFREVWNTWDPTICNETHHFGQTLWFPFIWIELVFRFNRATSNEKKNIWTRYKCVEHTREWPANGCHEGEKHISVKKLKALSAILKFLLSGVAIWCLYNFQVVFSFHFTLWSRARVRKWRPFRLKLLYKFETFFYSSLQREMQRSFSNCERQWGLIRQLDDMLRAWRQLTSLEMALPFSIWFYQYSINLAAK